MQRRPETLFIGSKVDRPVTTNSGLKVIWHHNTAYERSLVSGRPVVESSKEKTIANHIATVGTNLFEGNDLLPATLRSLLNADNLPAKPTVEGVVVSAGSKSIILGYRTIVDKKPHYFIAALAPAPIGGNLDKQLRSDFENLGPLNEKNSQEPIKSAKPLFEVVKPLAIGVTSFAGENFSVYTQSYMPYQALNGSVIDGQVILRYSPGLVPNPEAVKLNRRLFKQVETEEGRRVLDTHMRDLMQASCRIYLLLGGSYPRESTLASSDWLGTINIAGGLDFLGLTSLRGKMDRLNEREFVRDLRNQLVVDDKQQGKPFERFSPDEIMAVIADLKTKISDNPPASFQKPWWKVW